MPVVPSRLWWAFGALGASVLAAGTADAQPIVWSADAEAAVVMGLFDSDGGPGPTAGAARLDLTLTGVLTLDSGLELGAALGGGVERDHPVRDPRGGRAGACPPQLGDCPGVRGFYSGAFGEGPDADRDVRAQLETAYVFVSGGWGEASLGRDVGVGARFSLTPPTVTTAIGARQSQLDLTGLGAPLLRNDLAGPAAKLTLVSERILGVRLAAAYTPEADVRGLDEGFRSGSPAPTPFAPEQVTELGASFARTWSNGLRTEIGLTAATAVDGQSRTEFDRLTTATAGLNLAFEAWAGGIAWLGSDNGWRAGDRGYQALELGLQRTLGGPDGAWALSASAAAASDELTFVDHETGMLAARWRPAGRPELTFGVQTVRRDSPRLTPTGRGGVTERATGVFFGFRWTSP